MKNKIKDFLFKKRIKILRNKKGFSLLEVMVAVAIIGVISAIATPAFKANRKAAAKVAGSTSIGNIKRAYRTCVVLKPFDECNTLGGIGIECPDCESTTDTASGAKKFCVHLKKKSGGQEMKACFSVDAVADTTLTTMGGTLLDGTKLCHEKTSVAKQGGSGFEYPSTAASVVNPLQNCKVVGDCGQSVATPTAAGQKLKSCDIANKAGICASHKCT